LSQVNTPLSDKISRYTLKACDWKELLKLIGRIRTRIAGELKKRVDVVSCYEAGYDGFWLHRLLEAHGKRGLTAHRGQAEGVAVAMNAEMRSAVRA
jgi:transposase